MINIDINIQIKDIENIDRVFETISMVIYGNMKDLKYMNISDSINNLNTFYSIVGENL